MIAAGDLVTTIDNVETFEHLLKCIEISYPDN
jgi:hypothetical protein